MTDDRKGPEGSDDTEDLEASDPVSNEPDRSGDELDLDGAYDNVPSGLEGDIGIDPEYFSSYLGFSMKEAFARGFSYSDVLYLLDQCPYLQIVDGVGQAKPFDSVRMDEASSGWVIQNFGDAMTSSPGRLIFGMGYRPLSTDEEDEGGAGGVAPDGVGTMVNQSYVTVREMVALAIKQKWGHVKLIDGHPRLFRYAWVEAMRQGIAIEGFKPSDQDRQFQERIDRSPIDLLSRIDKSRSME